MDIVNTIARGEAHPDSVVSILHDGQLRHCTGADLLFKAGRVAARLHAIGIRRGHRVGICAGNSEEWILLDLACIAMGAVVAAFDTKMNLLEPGLLDMVRLDILFSDNAAAYAAVPNYRAIAEVTDWACGPEEVFGPRVQYAPTDAICIKFTSGSTGRPKGLLATVGSIDASITQAQALFGHARQDSILVYMPLSLLQQRYWIYAALAFGHTTVLSPHETVLLALSLARPTIIMGVPGFFQELEMLVRVRARRSAAAGSGETARLIAAFASVTGGRLRYLWTGSAPCPARLVAFYETVGVPLFNGYGLNETCIVSKNAPGAHRPGSVGKVLPGKTLSFDAQGQILVKSRYPVSDRYAIAFDPRDSDVFVGPDVVATGDTGYLDADGYLYITGRIKDLLVLRNGVSVQPGDVERAFAAHDCIDFALACGDDRAHLCALLWPSKPDADIGAVVAAVNAALPAHMRVLRHAVLGGLDRSDRTLFTTQMKPIRSAFYRRYASHIDTLYQKGPA